MAYTDRELKNATQVAYADLAKIQALMDDPRKVYTVDELMNHARTLYPTAEAADDLGDLDLYSLYEMEPADYAQVKDWKLVSFRDTNDTTGFYGCVLDTGGGNAIVGFRGSEAMDSYNNVKHDWVEADLYLCGNPIGTKQHMEVDKFFSENKDLLSGYNLTLTGHSLGGNLAEYGTINSGQHGLRDNIQGCYSFDGPGFSQSFINLRRNDIDAVSGRMHHYRWSFVGGLLQDLPGVNYKYCQLNGKPIESPEMIWRHDTIYLAFDENGNIIEGEQDLFASFMSHLSKGIDHLPAPVGSVVAYLIGEVWLNGMSLAERMFDENGQLTGFGLSLVSFIVAACILFPAAVLTVAVVSLCLLVAVVIAVCVYEFFYQMIDTVLKAIYNALVNVFNWSVEMAGNLVALARNLWKSFEDMWNSTFNKGYKYAKENTAFTVDTGKLREDGNALNAVCGALNRIREDLEIMNRKNSQNDTGHHNPIPRALTLLAESINIGKHCVNYLYGTADSFEAVEKELMAKFDEFKL